MYHLFSKVEDILIKIVLICLILLISSQIILKNEVAKENFLFLKNNLQYSFNNIVANRENALEVIKSSKVNEKGILKISSMQDLKLREVYILKNGKVVNTFEEGEILLEVADGDILSIDSRNYDSPLYFEISYISNNIQSLSAGLQIKTNGNLIRLNKIKIYNSKI